MASRPPAVTGDGYLQHLVRFVETNSASLIDSTVTLKLNPCGLHYVHSRLETLAELERLLSGAPVDYLRAYVSDLGDFRALEQLRRILRLVTEVKVVAVLRNSKGRDPTRVCLGGVFGWLRSLELRACDLSAAEAKGLLELRGTLERLVCYNSTDALRHVFASRIAEIKDSQQWIRLSFVSCPCNGLVLMDESLQLLPAVQTLDLSRNKFTKLDNLRKCIKLKYLDLGFNHLQNISLFNVGTCNLVKLVLRNNAISTLHGIENMKLLEGLDVSYNVISSFSELQILADLPKLQNLWLEGNPVCCSRWYRPHVFSLFGNPDKIKLDDKGISTREYWQRKIIVARKHKRPASYGFYSPANNKASQGENVIRKKRKQAHLASIQSEEENIGLLSEREVISGDNEIPGGDDTVGADDAVDVVELMNRVELMKKERAILWLREIREWMDTSPSNSAENDCLHMRREYHNDSGASQQLFGKSAEHFSDTFNASGGVSESDGSFANGVNGSTGHFSQAGFYSKGPTSNGIYEGPTHINGSPDDDLIAKGLIIPEYPCNTSSSTVGNSLGSDAYSVLPSSPPYYQEKILQRRQTLVEEILQLSADSYSVASSDSSCCSEDEAHESKGESNHWEADGALGNSLPDTNNDMSHLPGLAARKKHQLIFTQIEDKIKSLKFSRQDPCNKPDSHHFGIEKNDLEEKVTREFSKRSRKKPPERDIDLSTETGHSTNSGGLGKLFHGSSMDETRRDPMQSNAVKFGTADAAVSPGSSSFLRSDEFIENYYKTNIALSGSHETCNQYLRCDCVLEQESIYREREIALLETTEPRLYVLLVGTRFDGSGTIVSMLGNHTVKEVTEVTVGLGFQVVRVCISGGVRYLFITRDMEKSRQLLEILQVIDGSMSRRSLKSVGQAQVELFRRHICGGTRVGILQYSIVHSWHNNDGDKPGTLRSLVMTRSQLFLCAEDFRQFSLLSLKSSSPSYFSLVSRCNIADIFEMVIEESSHTVSLSIENATSRRFDPATIIQSKMSVLTNMTWKLNWSSEKGSSQFVKLLKALHAGTGCPLFIRCK
ncbi:hypothetical protein MLD38_032856 [Melastoma candidum]|uniref:Uncharacterized protein n=1 Tax=Melastoma candidum TaxID=119954 RepID=A0ACB9M654_9MYRT|nr:hypothetical protein MLD38_032856 [Melastoma candidum]